MFGLDQKTLMLQMQQAAEESKRRLDQTIVVGESGNGLIRIELNGNRKLVNFQLNTSLENMEKEDLEDLLSVALARALDAANTLNEQEVSASARQFLPGL